MCKQFSQQVDVHVVMTLCRLTQFCLAKPQCDNGWVVFVLQHVAQFLSRSVAPVDSVLMVCRYPNQNV